MTTLQQINSLLKEYIKIPLNSFYKRIIIAFLSLFILVSLIATISISKVVSLILLFTLLIVASLLAYGNYQEEKLDSTLKEIKENFIEEELFQTIEAETKALKQETTNKNFIAWGDLLWLLFKLKEIYD